MKEHNRLRLEQLIDPQEWRTKRISEITDWFIKQITPIHYDTLEVRMELDFEKLCHLLAEHCVTDPRKMTVKQFYALLEVVEKKNPTRKKHGVTL